MRVIACVVLTTLISAPAMAGRPLSTEDAGFIEKGGVEVESYFHNQSERDTARLTGLHIQPSVGIGFNTQLGIGVDFLRQFSDDFDSRKGSGEYALVGKTGIKELTDDAYGIAVAYGVDRTRATGERFRYDNSYLNGVVTVPWQQWLFHGNLGWQRSQLSRVTATTWALAAERIDAIKTIDLAVETYGDDHHAAWAQVSTRWNIVPERFSVDASYGEQMSSTHAKLLTIGTVLTF